MNITQTFYDNLAPHYDKLFLDWGETTREQASILDRIFAANGFDRSAKVLDCACGIGTQSIGLAAIGYDVIGSDISDAELSEAQKRAVQHRVDIRLEHADFCALSDVFDQQFDIVIAMDNALPHMLTKNDLEAEGVAHTAMIPLAEELRAEDPRTRYGTEDAEIKDEHKLVRDGNARHFVRAERADHHVVQHIHEIGNTVLNHDRNGKQQNVPIEGTRADQLSKHKDPLFS